MSTDSTTAAPDAPARMVCEIAQGVHVTWPGEPLRFIPEGTRFFVEAWVGDGWYRGHLRDDPRPMHVNASCLGLPCGD